MRSSTHRPRVTRGLAAVVTAALAVGGLTVTAAAPAQAAVTGTVTGGSFSWNVSAQAANHFNTKTTTGKATVASNVFTWSGGTGTVNPATGAAELDYSGTAKLAFVNGTTEYYSIRLTDPEISIDADGAGTIVADVAYDVTALSPASPAVSGSTENVVIARFADGDGAADDWTITSTLASLTDTPASGGYIAPGSQDATDVGLTDPELPLNSQSFTKQFLQALPTTLRSHFYASKSGNGSPTASNPNKVPGAFTATATLAAPTVTAEVTGASHASGVTIDVTGDGFRGVTNPGDAGIYVGVAEAGGIESYDLSAMDSFVTADWINATAIADGTFSRSYTLPTSKLDPAKEYSVYTWQSHSHSNTTQDTETPLDIYFPSVDLVLSHEDARVGDYVTALAQLPTSAVGSVEFFRGSTSIGTAVIRNGLAFATLAGLAVGEYEVTAVYLGDAEHFGIGASTVASVTVTKAAAGIVLTAPTASPYGKALVVSASVPNGTGAVEFVVDGKKVATRTLVAGAASATLSTKYAIGAHTVVVNYAGSAGVEAGTATTAVQVVKASASTISATGARFTKKTAPKVAVTIPKLDNGTYATGTVRIYVNGSWAKTATLKSGHKGKISFSLAKRSTSFTVHAVYAGNSTTNAITSSVTTISAK